MNVLADLASQLRHEETPISPHVVDPAGEQAFVSSGERAFAIEAVREGYLLHYGKPRLLAGHDADLGLLAGDYLYALGLDHLARRGDVEAVATLADLISRCAQLHAEQREPEVPALWRSAVSAIAGIQPQTS
jgi:hypothetical protein